MFFCAKWMYVCGCTCMWRPKVGSGTHPSPNSLRQSLSNEIKSSPVSHVFLASLLWESFIPPFWDRNNRWVATPIQHLCGFLGFNSCPITFQGANTKPQSHLSSPKIPFKECVIYFLDWAMKEMNKTPKLMAMQYSHRATYNQADWNPIWTEFVFDWFLTTVS